MNDVWAVVRRTANWGAWLLFGILVGFTLAVWPHLPTTIPYHYDSNGLANQWGSRWYLLYPLGACFGLFLLLTLGAFVAKRVKMPARFSTAVARLSRELVRLWCALARWPLLAYFGLWVYCDVTALPLHTIVPAVGISWLFGSLGAIVLLFVIFLILGPKAARHPTK